MSERIVNLRELGLEPVDSGPEGHHFSVRWLAAQFGAVLTGFGVYEVEPGESTWPYHFELNEEEWLLVVDGELTLRTPDGERTLRAGDIACFPPGADGAHAVRNDGPGTARFAMPSSAAPDGGGTVYPDTGIFKLFGPGFSHRGKLGEQVEYWEGTS
ncbi:MAG TPA: cupin domain-containing protein [Gaiellaceae bacterium]|nr:cupin domain-containing protein [Gaiellaceae bacterium]